MTDTTTATARVTVRCFAASRAALGFSDRTIALATLDGSGTGGGSVARSSSVAGGSSGTAPVVTVADVVAHLVTGAPSAEPVLARCSVLLDGRRAAPTDVVPDGATLDLLPPFAGG